MMTFQLNKIASFLFKLFYSLARILFIICATLLVVSIIPQLFLKTDDIRSAKKAKARTTVQTLMVALDRYKNDVGHYPLTNDSRLVANEITGFKSSPDALDDMSVQNTNWNGPYYTASKKDFYMRQRNQALIDPWGQPYHFEIINPRHNTHGCDIWSSGPNQKNQNGSGDDINNWD